MSEVANRVVEDFPVSTIDAAALAAQFSKNIGAPSGNKIRTTQDKKFLLPDGEKVEVLDAVIVNFGSSNTFYAEAFNRNKVTPPACFALGMDPRTMIPSENSLDRQADACNECPNNQWGSGNGGKGKACRNSRVIALMPTNADEESPIWILQTSPTAIKHFDDYVRNLTNRGIPPLGVITQIYFDPGSTFASLRFRATAKLADEALPVYASRVKTAEQVLMAEPEYNASAAE
jgi:hypothetical protein